LPTLTYIVVGNTLFLLNHTSGKSFFFTIKEYKLIKIKKATHIPSMEAKAPTNEGELTAISFPDLKYAMALVAAHIFFQLVCTYEINTRCIADNFQTDSFLCRRKITKDKSAIKITLKNLSRTNMSYRSPPMKN
jgi:hypothetical protein